MVLRYKDTREAECGGGADDRTDIVRVLHFTEDDNSWIRFHIEHREKIIKRQEQDRRVHDSNDALMHRTLPDKLPPAAGGEFRNRDSTHLEKRMKRDVAQIGREERLFNDARRIGECLHKRVLAVDIDLVSGG